MGDDYIMKNLDRNSDQCLNQPIESTNSNFQHCPVSKPITVSNLAETFTDSVPEGIDDLAKCSFPNNIIEKYVFLLFFLFILIGTCGHWDLQLTLDGIPYMVKSN